MKEPALLARIASEDQNPEIRKTAEERLEELKNYKNSYIGGFTKWVL
jgi:hypothetical protein